jgi:hypothetical protein
MSEDELPKTIEYNKNTYHQVPVSNRDTFLIKDQNYFTYKITDGNIIMEDIQKYRQFHNGENNKNYIFFDEMTNDGTATDMTFIKPDDPNLYYKEITPTSNNENIYESSAGRKHRRNSKKRNTKRRNSKKRRSHKRR